MGAYGCIQNFDSVSRVSHTFSFSQPRMQTATLKTCGGRNTSFHGSSLSFQARARASLGRRVMTVRAEKVRMKSFVRNEGSSDRAAYPAVLGVFSGSRSSMQCEFLRA